MEGNAGTAHPSLMPQRTISPIQYDPTDPSQHAAPISTSPQLQHPHVDTAVPAEYLRFGETGRFHNPEDRLTSYQKYLCRMIRWHWRFKKDRHTTCLVRFIVKLDDPLPVRYIAYLTVFKKDSASSQAAGLTKSKIAATGAISPDRTRPREWDKEGRRGVVIVPETWLRGVKGMRGVAGRRSVRLRKLKDEGKKCGYGSGVWPVYF